MLIKKNSYTQAIMDTYPNWTIKTARLHNEDGQYNDILIVNSKGIKNNNPETFESGIAGYI